MPIQQSLQTTHGEKITLFYTEAEYESLREEVNSKEELLVIATFENESLRAERDELAEKFKNLQGTAHWLNEQIPKHLENELIAIERAEQAEAREKVLLNGIDFALSRLEVDEANEAELELKSLLTSNTKEERG
jgi:hypothetical protein